MLPSTPTGEMLRAGAMKYLELTVLDTKDFVLSPHTLHVIGEIYRAMVMKAPSTIHPADSNIASRK